MPVAPPLIRGISALVLTVGCALPVLADGPRIPLHIRFDADAAKQLGDLGEMVTISAHFYGEAKPDAKLEPDEMGEITLGLEEFTVAPKELRVEVGASLAVAPEDQVKTPMLNVNVWTARYADENNLLDCTTVDGPVAELAGKEQQISCKLLPPDAIDGVAPPPD